MTAFEQRLIQPRCDDVTQPRCVVVHPGGVGGAAGHGSFGDGHGGLLRVRAGSLPLCVDADHGYGNALSVKRTVEELETAGVSGLTIEDTLLPTAFGGDDQHSGATWLRMLLEVELPVTLASQPPTRVAAARQTLEKVAESLGEIIDEAEIDRRYPESRTEPNHTFVFGVEHDYNIDGGSKGNAARYINHSCQPNCETTVNGYRITIRSLRTIQPGEELTYDYAYERDTTSGTSTASNNSRSCMPSASVGA